MKKEREQKIIRKQVSKKIDAVRGPLSLIKEITSWSSYMRIALGMSVTQLASRLGCSQSSVSELEKRERESGITIKKLKELAGAMDCELVYAFIPKTSLMDTVTSQAKKKAISTINASDTHMALEDQLVKTELKERIDDLTEEMMYSKYLWDEYE